MLFTLAAIPAVNVILITTGSGLQIIGFVWLTASASLELGDQYQEYGHPRRLVRLLEYWFAEPPNEDPEDAHSSSGHIVLLRPLICLLASAFSANA